jgi:hypothetical protein
MAGSSEARAEIRGAARRLIAALNQSGPVSVEVTVQRRDLFVLLATFGTKRPDNPDMHPNQV